MKHAHLTLLMALAAALPLAAQSDGGLDDILTGFSNPHYRRILRPDSVTPTGIFPSKMKIAYGFNKVANAGAGQTIAVVDAYDDPNIEADLGVFSTQFKLPACTTANGCFKKIYQTGTPPPVDTNGWTVEIALDVEWVHAIAPQATILLVEANSNSNADLYAAVDVAVQNGATVVSLSWGGAEAANESQSDFHFAVPGVMFVASDGDSGHYVQYPAASPYVVGVGGTTLKISSKGVWMNETAWSGSGGGTSLYESEPPYQSAVQTTGYRSTPDVAYDGNGSTGVPVYNSYACGGGCTTGWSEWGGTSLGAPQWAALFAIANSMRVAIGKGTLNQVQYLLYPDAEGDYHDITVGSNGSCGSQCKAGPGYDFITGVGSPQANLLIPALVAAP